MNVLIVPSWYPNELNNVVGSFFKEQAECIARKGINVTVFAINILSPISVIKQPLKCKLFKLNHFYENNVNTYIVNVCSFGLNRINLFYKIYLALFKYYFNTVNKELDRIDIVHAHSYKYAGIACCKIIKDIPIIITEHSSAIHMGRLSIKDIDYLRFVLKTASRFICVSKALKNKVLELTKLNKGIIVIPNMVSNVFSYHKSVELARKKKFVFLSISNLIKLKKVDILIKSFWLAFKNYEDVILKIAGQGSEEKRIKELIKELHLENRVKMLGQLNRTDIINAYNDSNVFIMVSESETFGVVYVESLMCGLPTIGTRNGGAEDILNCYGGYLCGVNDVEDISSKMLNAFYNYDKIDRFKIHNDAFRRFSESNVTDDIINVYTETIK